MKKRILLLTAVAAALSAGCAKDNFDSGLARLGMGRILLGFNEPVSVTRSAAAAYDTNSFILSVVSAAGDTVWTGPYGHRPKDLTVRHGTYEISALSREFNAPAFDAPQLGDRQIAVVSNGENVSVSLLCRRLNAGIKLKMTGSFLKKYPEGKLLLMQSSGGLEYDAAESRTGYFHPGDVAFIYRNAERRDTLFARSVSPGELYDLTVNASGEDSKTGFTIEVDDSATEITQTLTVGERFDGADGQTSATALDVAAAAGRPGDTLWVWGYVVGGDCSATSVNVQGPFVKTSNIAIASSPLETSRERCMPVELSRTAVKAALNLVDNPSLLGRKIFVKGTVSAYFSSPGLKSVTEFLIP